MVRGELRWQLIILTSVCTDGQHYQSDCHFCFHPEWTHDKFYGQVKVKELRQSIEQRCLERRQHYKSPALHNEDWIQRRKQRQKDVQTPAMGFAIRVRSAGQKYGPMCHQRDHADVTEFVTLVRLSSLGQHVGVLVLAGYKRQKSALTAGPIVVDSADEENEQPTVANCKGHPTVGGKQPCGPFF